MNATNAQYTYEIIRFNPMFARSNCWQAIRSDGLVMRGRDGGTFRTRADASRAVEADRKNPR